MHKVLPTEIQSILYNTIGTETTEISNTRELVKKEKPSNYDEASVWLNAKLLFTIGTEELITDFEKYSQYFVTEKSHQKQFVLHSPIFFVSQKYVLF